jgi:ABC-type transport system involved in multi-copper enzyme maturation permease subunit
MMFPIPEIVIISMIFNGTISFSSLILLESTIRSSVHVFVKNVLSSMLSNFMVQGIVTGVLATVLFVYERETGVLDTELVYSHSRKELFIGKFLALVFASIIYVSATILILVIENLRGMWLVESIASMLVLFLPMLIQMLFIISICIFISVISQRSMISILSVVLIFYSLGTMSSQYNPEEMSFLSFIPPLSTQGFLIVPHKSINALVATLAISIAFLLVAYIYFTRLYEVK